MDVFNDKEFIKKVRHKDCYKCLSDSGYICLFDTESVCGPVLQKAYTHLTGDTTEKNDKKIKEFIFFAKNGV